MIVLSAVVKFLVNNKKCHLLSVTKMDNCDRYSKSKYSKHHRHEENIKSTRSRHSINSKDLRTCESRTPPLPTKSNSIEELLKQRQYLKDELKKFVKCSDSDLSKRKCYKSEENYHKDNQIKYLLKPTEETKRKKRLDRESSPTVIDSEDEEMIIEQRRKQRKQILEKFNDKNAPNISEEDCKQMTSANEKHRIDQKNNENKELKTNNHNISDTNIKSVNEIPDMFSEIDDFAANNASEPLLQDNESNINLTDNWDDSEGYYNIRIGDVLNSKRYVIKNILGKGVFANVVQAEDKDNSTVAIKIIRNNDLMYSTGLKEITILKKITDADPENKYHCIKMLNHFTHKGHLCIVLESLYIDLRQILKKYGKHGLNMKALISYSRQILTGLKFLERIGVIHADIKPDNLLVNEKKNILKLSDFGSAMEAKDNEATPYLVSRFYRAPEIILGIPYSHSVDVWSTACTVFEMATGRILFTGSSNNKMLKCFMDLKGKIPNKLIRKGKFKNQHFNYNNNYILHKKDELTGREKFVEVSNINPVKDLFRELKKYCRNLATNEEKKLTQFKDMLDKMLTIDPSQRIKIKDCLRHPFISENL